MHSSNVLCVEILAVEDGTARLLVGLGARRLSANPVIEEYVLREHMPFPLVLAREC